jgi:isoleucyl-tRNA synthetase
MVGTAGWTLDEQGRAMSKSLGNGVDPVDIADRLGAEVIRVWTASVDFREDVAASENLMQRVSDNYRKLRNTFRFLLGNLHDFDPGEHAVAWEKLEPLDQYMLVRASELTAKILGWYEQFEFHRVYHALNEFVNVDLSALYLDVLKDRLYTFAPNSPARRAAQTVLWKITDALARLVAPILSFLADEVWQYLPADAKRDASIHTTLFPKPDDLAPRAFDPATLDWPVLLLLRDRVLAALEAMRANKEIGKSLEAKVKLIVQVEDGYLHELLDRYYREDLDPLRELFNVSHVDVVHDTSALDQGWFKSRVIDGTPTRELVATAIKVEVSHADGKKCARCWNYRTDIGVDPRWPVVCGRCAAALDEIGFPPLNDEDAA